MISVLESKHLFGYISVPDGKHIRLKQSCEGAIQLSAILSSQKKYEKYTVANHINVLFLFRTLPGLYSRISLNFLHLFHLVFHIHADVSELILMQSYWL